MIASLFSSPSYLNIPFLQIRWTEAGKDILMERQKKLEQESEQVLVQFL